MLKYLWMVTQDLFLAVTYTTWIHALLSRLYGRRGRAVHGAALGLGVLASVAFAVGKQTTNRILTSRWNHYLYVVYIVLVLLFLLLCLFVGRSARPDRFRAGDALLCGAASAISAVVVFYSLPSVLVYPFNFNTMGQGVFSAYYMTRLAGWALALVLLLVYACLMRRCAENLKPFGLLRLFTDLGLVSFAVYCFIRFFAPWVSRSKWVQWPVKYDPAVHGWIGKMLMFTANHSMLFLAWIPAALAAAVAILFFARNIRVTEPYENSAQRRKLRAGHRRFRRVAAAVAVCLVIVVVSLTAVKTYDTRVVELSAPETYTVADGKIYISLEDVNDGHLHRFEYRTDNNVDVRWIVVKKPNAASYGVGLDACEVCGNAGYYERNGQIVCKRCDVVMNINTIGFKGGCNPIPLSYEVSEGQLVFQVADLVAAEREFR